MREAGGPVKGELQVVLKQMRAYIYPPRGVTIINPPLIFLPALAKTTASGTRNLGILLPTSLCRLTRWDLVEINPVSERN